MLRAVAGQGTSPVYQSSTTASNTGTSTLTINKPTDVTAGDLLVALLVMNGTAGWNQLSGWTRLIDSKTDPSTSLQFKIADGTEGATFAFTRTSGTNRKSGTIMRFTNAGFPYVSTVQTGSASTQTAPSVTIASDNSLVLSVFTADASAQTWTGVRTSPIVSFGTQCSFDVSYDKVNAGASGTSTATMSSSNTYACFQVGIPNVSYVPPKSVTFITSSAIAASQTTFTFSGVNFGNPSPYRSIIVVANARTIGLLPAGTATIGGVSANRANTTSSSAPANIFSANVPTGSTGSIVISFSSFATSGCAIAVYACYGLGSAVARSADWGLVTGASNTQTVTAETDDFIFAGLLLPSNLSVTWTNVTQNATQAISDSRQCYFASNTGSGSGSIDITAAFTSTTSSLVVANFR